MSTVSNLLELLVIAGGASPSLSRICWALTPCMGPWSLPDSHSPAGGFLRSLGLKGAMGGGSRMAVSLWYPNTDGSAAPPDTVTALL